MGKELYDIKTIAFYLPQYHSVPENDIAYGKGFTEWTNTKKSVPLYEKHYQPRTPLGENYYNLLEEGVMESQACLAKRYGLYGFCFYHYWFKDGKKILEKPLERMLDNPKIDIPFCLCWANENWTKRWDGGNNEVIAIQDYDDIDGLKKHVDYLCQFFADSRYITIDEEPMLVIYRPEIIPNLKKYISVIRKQVAKNGFKGVKLVCQHPVFYFEDVNLNLFDYYIQFQPAFVQQQMRIQNLSTKKKVAILIKKCITKLGMRRYARSFSRVIGFKRETNNRTLELRDYDDDMDKILEYCVDDKRLIAGIFTDWDNTPRRKNGLSYIGSTPEKFGYYLNRLILKVKNEYDNKIIFINAWNEWGEGAYLEPDEKYGYGYLEALNKALSDCGE